MSNARTSRLKPNSIPIINPGPADNEHKIILPKNTTANLAEISNEEASIAYDTDQQTIVVNQGSGFVPVSGGGGDATSIQGEPVDATTPDIGNLLVFDGSSWVPQSNLIDPTARPIFDFSSNTLRVNSYTDSVMMFFPRADAGQGATPAVRINSNGVIESVRVDEAGYQTLSVQPIGGQLNLGSGAGVFPDAVLIRGNPIRMKTTGNTPVVNYVWTALDASGAGQWMPSASAPVGDPDTVAFFNNSGNLTDDVGFTFDQGALALSHGFESAGGDLDANGDGSYVHGSVDNAGVISASGTGATASGFNNGAFIRADGNGANAYGYAANNGQINASTNGSTAFGRVETSGIIATDQQGSLVFGYAIDSGEIQAGVAAEGAQAFGFARTNAAIYAAAAGAFAWGHSEGTDSEIEASGEGAEAHGLATSGGTITAGGTGSVAFGNAADTGNITSNDDGSMAFGTAPDAGSNISTTGFGSLAFGQAFNASTISTGDPGALAHGSADAGFNITASGNGAYVGGVASLTAHTNSGVAGFSQGDSNVNTSDLAFTQGQGHNNNTYLTTVVGRFSETPASGNEAIWDTNDPLFVIGNGDDDGNRHNCFAVNKLGEAFAYTRMNVANALNPIGPATMGAVSNAWAWIIVNQVREADGTIVLRTATKTLENETGAVFDWSDSTTIVAKRHLDSSANVPIAPAAGAGAGTGATVTDVSTGGVSSDTAGRFKITTGTGATTGIYATITFGQPYINDPIVIVTPANANSADVTGWFISGTSTEFNFEVATVPFADATDYDFNYHVIGVQA